MKKMMAMAFLLLVTGGAWAQNKAVDKIFTDYKEKGCFSLDLSGNFISGFLKGDGQNQEELKQLAQNIDKFRIINIPNEIQAFSDSQLRTLKKSIKNDHYEDLVAVREKDSDIAIFIKEKQGVVTDMVMLMHNHDGIFIINLTGNIPRNKVNELTNGVKFN